MCVEQRLRRTCLKRRTCFHWYCHHLSVRSQVEQLLSVTPPRRVGSSGGRDLILRARPGESLNIDLIWPILVRRVHYPLSVGREFATVLIEVILQERPCRLVSLERQHP